MVNASGRHAVDVEKEQLIFSAAHFITFGDNICERLHGHNYRVRCRVEGELNEHGYVVDFIALRDALQRVTKELDHRVLLPMQHPHIRVGEGDSPREVLATFAERRWVFPVEDCVLLPLSNTTAELLARYIFEQLGDFWAACGENLRRVEVGVDENEGQWGSYVWISTTSRS
jgi:6-pyruvoyltetrahydropterin/6-carboxytetrahydropterin synthase